VPAARARSVVQHDAVEELERPLRRERTLDLCADAIAVAGVDPFEVARERQQARARVETERSCRARVTT